MKKIYILLFFILIFGCSAEKKDDEQQVKNTVLYYLEGMLNHQYSDNYPIKYSNIVFHPDVNPIGAHNAYVTITDNLESFPGLNIVTNAKIISITRSDEKVYSGQQIQNDESSFFVKIMFHAVAIQKKSGMHILSKPIDITEYLILGKDSGDKKYKIVDIFPEPNSKFLDLSYAIEKIDLVGRVSKTNNITLLEMELNKIKK